LDELPDVGRVVLLGLSFKANTDDLRGSPAIHVARRLVDAGHYVIAYDPAVRTSDALAAAPGIHIAADAGSVFVDVDAVVIATEWPEFAEVDYLTAARQMRSRNLFDGRGIISAQTASEAGLAYRGVGRQSRDPDPVPPPV
jgi:UDPglucose 6-dehydrogenase